jgi:hypothetical protein
LERIVARQFAHTCEVVATATPGLGRKAELPLGRFRIWAFGPINRIFRAAGMTFIYCDLYEAIR